MDVLVLIDKLDDLVHNAKKIMLTDEVRVDREEIYDLLADPDELTNLAAHPANAALLKKLRAAAIAELKRTDAKMVNSLPPVKE